MTTPSKKATLQKSNPVRATVTLYASQTRGGSTLLYRIRRRAAGLYDLNGTRYENSDGVNSRQNLALQRLHIRRRHQSCL